MKDVATAMNANDSTTSAGPGPPTLDHIATRSVCQKRSSLLTIKPRHRHHDACYVHETILHLLYNEVQLTNLMKTSRGSLAPRRGVMHRATASQLKNMTSGTKLPKKMLIRIRPMSPPNCAHTTVITRSMETDTKKTLFSLIRKTKPCAIS